MKGGQIKDQKSKDSPAIRSPQDIYASGLGLSKLEAGAGRGIGKEVAFTKYIHPMHCRRPTTVVLMARLRTLPPTTYQS